MRKDGQGHQDAGKNTCRIYNKRFQRNEIIYSLEGPWKNAQNDKKNKCLFASLLVHDGSELLVHLLQKLLVLRRLLVWGTFLGDGVLNLPS